MGGNKNKSTGRPQVLPLTAQDIELQNIAVAQARAQSDIFNRTAGFQGSLVDALQGDNFAQGLVESSRGLSDPLSQSILQQELARVQGGGISDSQRASIEGARSSALGVLGSDIDTFAGSQRDALFRDTAGSLGLRPRDTPIQDRGFSIATEATRQFGQGARDLSGQAFQAELSLPLEAAGRNAALLGIQGDLAQNAFNRRLSLSDQAISGGLSAAAPGGIAGTVSAVRAPKVAGQITKQVGSGGGIFTS